MYSGSILSCEHSKYHLETLLNQQVGSIQRELSKIPVTFQSYYFQLHLEPQLHLASSSSPTNVTSYVQRHITFSGATHCLPKGKDIIISNMKNKDTCTQDCFSIVSIALTENLIHKLVQIGIYTPTYIHVLFHLRSSQAPGKLRFLQEIYIFASIVIGALILPTFEDVDDAPPFQLHTVAMH